MNTLYSFTNYIVFSLHGPSNHANRLNAKQKLRRKLLFGTDSESEANESVIESSVATLIERENRQQLELTESEEEQEDVLEITITNDLLASPAHANLSTPTKQLASPKAETPTYSPFVSPTTLQRTIDVPLPNDSTTAKIDTSQASPLRRKKSILISPRKQINAPRTRKNPFRANAPTHINKSISKTID